MWEAVFICQDSLQKMYFETEDDCWVFANWLSAEGLGYVVEVSARESV